MWGSRVGSMQRKPPVCRPESRKNSDVIQETKEVRLARVRHMFISCVEYSGYFLPL